MAKVKKVGFNFFRPVISNNKDQNYFSFTDIFENIRLDYIKGRSTDDEKYKLVYTYNGEPARLADISIDVETQQYHLVFERLDYQVPSRTTLHGDSEALELEDDEYIGHDVNVLYDSLNHIFMIQRNRSAIGPTGIQTFLDTIIENFVVEVKGNFHLAIVSDATAKKRAFDQKAYRNINFKVVGSKARGIIEKFTNSNDVGVDFVEIIFSTKTGKNNEIEDDFAKEILEEYIDDPEVQKLKIRAIKEEGEKVEPIDLIDQKLQTFCEFEFNKTRYLNPISVFENMKYKYDKEGYKNIVLRMCNQVESIV